MRLMFKEIIVQGEVFQNTNTMEEVTLWTQN